MTIGVCATSGVGEEAKEECLSPALGWQEIAATDKALTSSITKREALGIILNPLVHKASPPGRSVQEEMAIIVPVNRIPLSTPRDAIYCMYLSTNGRGTPGLLIAIDILG